MGLVAKHATDPIAFAIAENSSQTYLIFSDYESLEHLLTGRLSPPLAPGQRPPRTAWGPYRLGLQTYPPFCPPQSARAVDNSANHALRDSKVVRPSSHRAATLRCQARPETGGQSGGDRLQDRQMNRQPVARQEMQLRWWVRRKRISSAASRKWRNAG